MVQRRIVHFSGRVQGVFFRANTEKFAHDLPLSGTVRNMDNGDVELIVQGEAQQIDQLLSSLREHYGAMIRRIHQETAEPIQMTGKVRVVY